MNCFGDYLERLLNTYWGNSVYQWLFYAGLLIIFFVEQDSRKKQVLFWMPLMVYFLLLSPIFQRIGAIFWWEENIAYYCRQFSLVPIFIVMAYAGVLVTNAFLPGKSWIVLGMECLFVILFGSAFIYSHNEYRYEKSENAYKIPADLILICDYMDSVDEDPVLAINSDLSYMVRQYDPAVHLLIGPREYDNKLSNELGALEPDVCFVMTKTCSLGGDFVAVNNIEQVRQVFSAAGYRPCFETEGLLLYEAGGYPGVRFTYNDIEQIVRRDYYDEDGLLCLTEDGVASVEYSYDDQGRVLEEHYFGTNGNAILNKKGYAGLIYTYGEKGMIDRMEYMGLDGKPAVAEGLGYASIVYTRDERGNVLEEHYLDAKDQPIALEDGYAGVRREFDENNRVVRLTYLDSDAKPVLNVDGVASISYDYENELGTLELYYDVDGNPVENSNGRYGVINGYGSNGCVAYQIFVDKNGKPVETNAGYAKAAYMYDRSNRLIRVSFYDVDDNSVECTGGYAGYRRSYDEDGEYIDAYFRQDGEILAE